MNWRAEPTPTEEAQAMDWDAFGEELEAVGDRKWREQAAKWRPGRAIEFDGRWALVGEWHGEVRAWCNWCDKVVLSVKDKNALGLEY